MGRVNILKIRRRARIDCDRRRSKSTAWQDLAYRGVFFIKLIQRLVGSWPRVVVTGPSAGRGAFLAIPIRQERSWHRLSSVFRRGGREVFQTRSRGQG